MKPFTISYDLDKPGQNYEFLIARLRQLGAVRILYSMWVLKSSMSAVEIRDDLQRAIDSNDRLIVAGLTGEAAWVNLMIGNDSVKQSIAA